MKHIRSVCIASVPILMLFPSSSLCQSRTGSVSIRVSDAETEKPVPQAEVRLFVFGQGNSSYQGISDAGGRMFLGAVTVAKYRVVASAPGYDPAQDEADVVIGQMSVVLLRLRPKTEAKNNLPGGAISSNSLSIPTQAQKEFHAGIALIESDPAGSISHFRKATEIYPRFAEAFLMLAVASLKLHQRQDAIDASDRAIHADPNFSRAYTLRGRLWFDDREFSKAEASLTESIRLEPRAWDAHFELARCYYNMGRLAEALDQAIQARDLPQSNPISHLLLVDIYLKSGLRREAITELEAFQKAEPSSPMIPKVRQKIAELQKLP